MCHTVIIFCPRTETCIPETNFLFCIPETNIVSLSSLMLVLISKKTKIKFDNITCSHLIKTSNLHNQSDLTYFMVFSIVLHRLTILDISTVPVLCTWLNHLKWSLQISSHIFVDCFFLLDVQIMFLVSHAP